MFEAPCGAKWKNLAKVAQTFARVPCFPAAPTRCPDLSGEIQPRGADPMALSFPSRIAAKKERIRCG